MANKSILTRGGEIATRIKYSTKVLKATNYSREPNRIKRSRMRIVYSYMHSYVFNFIKQYNVLMTFSISFRFFACG